MFKNVKAPMDHRLEEINKAILEALLNQHGESNCPKEAKAVVQTSFTALTVEQCNQMAQEKEKLRQVAAGSAKVSKGEILVYFNDIFDASGKVKPSLLVSYDQPLDRILQ